MITLEKLKGIKEESLPLLEERLASSEEVEKTEEGYRLSGDFYKKQVRIALRNCGIIDANNIKDYIALDGYSALADIVTNKTAKDVIEVMKAANLRGRGGAGFPAGIKWETAYDYDADQKYVICNADEGDPGAFMDRRILEEDPHTVIEAMAIAGYAIGSDHGYIYVRAEYPLAVERLNHAIKEATELGLLGENILGSGFNFTLELRLGAGAFVCGEGTALMESIEGKRGMPRTKIYRTAHRGLWQKPTIINNVETFANVPVIFQKGADWFKSIGTEDSPGTKVFALVGKVKNAGLVEVPMGMTLREVVYEIGGGVENDRELKAIQTGGPSGGCIPVDLLDTPVDFKSLASIGSIMGSGGMVVMNDTDCMVDISKFFLDFTVEESCGKCTPCREGTKRMLEVLEKITSGEGEEKDIETMERLAKVMTEASLCGLGQTAGNPVVSTLKYFREEYEAHIVDKSCPAGVCQELLNFFIDDTCIGCGMCKRNCPVEAITGKAKERHVIDMDICIKCGNCFEVCPTNSVIKK